MSIIIDPIFQPLDDVAIEPGKNGKPALADQIQRAIVTLNRIAYRGRTLLSWWGGDDATNSANVLKSLWSHKHRGGQAIAMRMLGLDNDNGAAASQSVTLSIDGAAVAYPWSPGSAATTQYDPPDLRSYDIYVPDVEADFGAAIGSRYTMDVGSLSANGPHLVSGVLYEPGQASIEPGTATTSAYIPEDWCRPDGSIVATAPGSSLADLDRVRLMLLHNWNTKRPTWGWSIAKAGTNYVDFTTSKTEYRYIWDQTIGTGGTAASVTGPGITIPVPYAASGINTTLKCAIYVYAAMSGATDTGQVAISHKASGGASMTSFDRGTDPITISGTTFAWYPTISGGFAPNTHTLRADLGYDRVVLAARSSGSTDSVRIGAFVIFPFHSTTIA